MTDFKQLAIDCEEYASACHRGKLWALASHERACRDAIFELMNRVKVVEASAKNTEEIANNWEIFYCEEFGRRKEAETRAEKAEAEVERLRTERVEIMVGDEELTISQLFDRYTEIKARCDRLEKAREETKAETKRLGDQLIEAVCCREFAVNWFHRMDTECELCSHVEDTADCEASNYECGLCKADCHCRDCKENLEGRSNWDFAGWDKVMEIGKEGRTKQ